MVAEGRKNMGFDYLKGKRWSQVTRDERFFCQRLYELIRSEPSEAFVDYINKTLSLDLPLVGEWEIGFEVCFYRDLWQLEEQKGILYSPKRTFDLCLFGENDIVIIEAKAAAGFDQDQNAVFEKDIDEVKKLTRIEHVLLIGLCSSKYDVDADLSATFNGRILRWKDLSERYGDDEILARADDVYERREAFSSRGRNSDIKLSGNALLEAFLGGADWWVGRGGGGLTGERFSEDIRTGRWKTQIYEVNTQSSEPPSPNYFGLDEFAKAVRIEFERPDSS
jgi:hypothetical protein